MENAMDSRLQLPLGTYSRIHNTFAAGDINKGEAIPSSGQLQYQQHRSFFQTLLVGLGIPF